jgi:hypothetical protein
VCRLLFSSTVEVDRLSSAFRNCCLDTGDYIVFIELVCNRPVVRSGCDQGKMGLRADSPFIWRSCSRGVDDQRSGWYHPSFLIWGPTQIGGGL